MSVAESSVSMLAVRCRETGRLTSKHDTEVLRGHEVDAGVLGDAMEVEHERAEGVVVIFRQLLDGESHRGVLVLHVRYAWQESVDHPRYH